MKHIFIINPTSGNGKALKACNMIKKVCKEDKIDFEIHITKEPGDATKIVKKYKKNNYIIFSVGGDGTLNEVVNGIIGSKNMLGVIPCGSGNDFYRTLDKMENGIHLIDVGKINKKYFINVASIGIDAEVGENANIMKKIKVPKTQIYNASIIYTFFKYKFKNIDFKIDNTKGKEKCTILTICNGKMYGGGYKIAPEASLTDGYFDVYFVKKIRKTLIPFLLKKLKNGTHGTDESVNMFKANKIEFRCDKDLICGYDGELLVDNKFKIKILKKALYIYNNKSLVKRIVN